MDAFKGDKLYRIMLEGMRKFYSNPENMKKFEKWEKNRKNKNGINGDIATDLPPSE